MAGKRQSVPKAEPFALGRINRRLRGSKIIYEHRDELAMELMALGSSKITDVIDWDADGNVKVKPIDKIPESALSAIKKIKVTPTSRGDILEVEMVDKVRVLQLLAKSAGLLDNEKEIDKPSVVSIEMVMPGEEKKDG
tara:strand:- start:356 stop:769 length:414 start_codon:yes stop_codon:yes gene_type:complete